MTARILPINGSSTPTEGRPVPSAPKSAKPARPKRRPKDESGPSLRKLRAAIARKPLSEIVMDVDEHSFWGLAEPEKKAAQDEIYTALDALMAVRDREDTPQDVLDAIRLGIDVLDSHVA